MAKRNSGLIIGAIFAGSSLLLTATVYAPLLTVLPGVFVETIAAKLVNNEPYSNVGKLTIEILSVLFLLILILCILSIIKKIEKFGQLPQRRIVAIMILLLFILNPLCFYIYWGLELNFRSDGQLLFASLISFPISGFLFLPIGLLIDLVKNRSMSKFNGTIESKGEEIKIS